MTTDLTKITTPFGLLNVDTHKKRLKSIAQS